MITSYTADADVPLVAGQLETEEHLPFFHPNRLNRSDLCYAATGLIRYQKRYTLIHGQVAKVGNPASGRFNQDVEFVLYLLLAKLAAGSVRRFDYAMADLPGHGNSSLAGESAVYTYAADSCCGFAGTEADRLNPVDRMDVIDMLTGPVVDFTRRVDGQLPFLPRFYRPLHRSEPRPVFPLRRYDVTTSRWLDMVEVEGLVLPFVDRDEDFATELKTVETVYAAQATFRWGSDLYVGTDTFTPEPGVLVAGDVAQQAQIEHLHDTSVSMRLSSRGLAPGWCRLPRFVSAEKPRHEGLRQILNANGMMVWRKLLSGW